MHRVRVYTRLLYTVLTRIVPESDDERLASTISSQHVSVERIRKAHMQVIIFMRMDDPSVRALMHTLKYHGSAESAGRIAILLASPIAQICIRESIDYIVPVPLSSKRFRKRGFNQVTYACTHMSHVEPVIGRMLSPTLLTRNRHTLPQTDLSRSERVRNMSGAFSATAAVHGKRILLLDDVVTTGATLAAACDALRSSGAATVVVCAFAGR